MVAEFLRKWGWGYYFFRKVEVEENEGGVLLSFYFLFFLWNFVDISFGKY